MRILLGDQHCPAVVSDSCNMCTIVVRYSNATLEDIIEYLLMPLVRDGLINIILDAKGFIDIVKIAIQKKLDMHIEICSMTSLLMAGPAGYTASMTVVPSI